MALTKHVTLHSIVINYNADGVFQEAYRNECVQVLEDGVVIGDSCIPTGKTLVEIKAAVAALT